MVMVQINGGDISGDGDVEEIRTLGYRWGWRWSRLQMAMGIGMAMEMAMEMEMEMEIGLSGCFFIHQ